MGESGHYSSIIPKIHEEGSSSLHPQAFIDTLHLDREHVRRPVFGIVSDRIVLARTLVELFGTAALLADGFFRNKVYDWHSVVELHGLRLLDLSSSTGGLVPPSAFQVESRDERAHRGGILGVDILLLPLLDVVLHLEDLYAHLRVVAGILLHQRSGQSQRLRKAGYPKV